MVGRMPQGRRRKIPASIDLRCCAGGRSRQPQLLRKEVIQPQVPLRLPCYDFTPVTSHTMDGCPPCGLDHRLPVQLAPIDRKSTRLNSSHVANSYAVFCLKKKK